MLWCTGPQLLEVMGRDSCHWEASHPTIIGCLAGHGWQPPSCGSSALTHHWGRKREKEKWPELWAGWWWRRDSRSKIFFWAADREICCLLEVSSLSLHPCPAFLSANIVNFTVTSLKSPSLPASPKGNPTPEAPSIIRSSHSVGDGRCCKCVNTCQLSSTTLYQTLKSNIWCVNMSSS